jgi:hypothetical protein
MTQAYPLQWPEGFPRTRSREKGQFKTSLSGALKNVQGSLVAFGRDSGRKLEHIVLSSNVSLGAERPQDPGVAAWFTWDGLQVCIAVDRYATVEANLQAIYHIIEARRVELRHGTLALVHATMKGFIALPAPAKKTWREVFGFSSSFAGSRTEIEARYRALAKERHPDTGGSAGAMAELNEAKAEADREMTS